MRDFRTARSLLFVPGNRPERFARALEARGDVVVMDLEDAVPPVDKHRALSHVVDLLAHAPGEAVRINDPRTPQGAADVAKLGSMGRPVQVLVPKADDVAVLAEVHASLPTGSRIVPLIETARGVFDARALAEAPGVVRLAFGHLDLCAELGLRPDDVARLMPARFALVAASAAAGLPAPVDGVCTEVRDAEVVAADTRTSLAGGFTAKLCIHPAQVALVHQALAPEPDELAWARRILEGGSEHEVRVVDGHMVDRPVYLRALGIAARAGA